MNLNYGVSGEYKLVIQRNGEVIREVDWFDNIVLNSGLDRLGTGSSPMTVCRLGTGTSIPHEDNLQLDAQVGSTSSWGMSSVVNAGNPTYHSLYTLYYSFSQGSVVGNISEIGTGWTAGPSGGLFSRALITDANGNPTTITLLAIDQLTVYYRFKVYPTLLDSTGSFTINGEVYNYTSRMCNLTSFGQSSNAFNTWQWNYPENVTYYPSGCTLGSLISGGPSYTGSVGSGGRNITYSSTGNYAYVSGSYYIDSNWSIGIQLANIGGIQGFRFSYGYAMGIFNYQVVLDKVITKDNTKTFSINTRISWSRY